MDAYIYGFARQERGLPFDAPEETGQVMERQSVPNMDDFPYLIEAATELSEAGYDYNTEFEFGLDVVVDGLEKYAR